MLDQIIIIALITYAIFNIVNKYEKAIAKLLHGFYCEMCIQGWISLMITFAFAFAFMEVIEISLIFKWFSAWGAVMLIWRF
jgi:hypothetical protein